jgi:hypothetical protein
MSQYQYRQYFINVSFPYSWPSSMAIWGTEKQSNSIRGSGLQSARRSEIKEEAAGRGTFA